MTENTNAISEQFKAELFALLRKYDVEMEVQEDTSGYQSYATGVNFFSYTQYDDDGNVTRDCIDVNVGKMENGNS